MKNQFRIQKRKVSPNVIEKNVGTNKKGHWVVYFTPVQCRKKIADAECERLLEFLNNEDEQIRFDKVVDEINKNDITYNLK